MIEKSPYRQSEPVTWTRIEMLLALYAGAIEQVELAIKATEAGKSGNAAVHRTRGAALVTAIRSGVDPRYGDLPVTVNQLCEFVQHTLADGGCAKMKSGLKVLNELNEGFAGIRNDANRMEQSGEIPSLSQTSVEVSC